MDLEEEFSEIKKALEIAKPYGLEVEIIHAALEHAQEFPEHTIAECMMSALSDWDIL